MQSSSDMIITNEARVGRLKQRYTNTVINGNTIQTRQVVGTVPYQINAHGTINILLINSRKHPNEWMLPKGGWETDETIEQCAERETWEEAGCLGVLQTTLASELVEGGKEYQWHTYMSLAIGECKDDWPEMSDRSRKFFSANDVRSMLSAQGRRKDRFVQLKAVDHLLKILL